MLTSGPVRDDLRLHDDDDYGDVRPYWGKLYETTSDGKKCLLKTAHDKSTEAAVLLRREYEISCNLQHPYILTPLRYASDTPAGAAIVMEFIEGITLTAFLQSRPAMSTRKRLLEEILEAVEYLHKKGLLHNDLKTDNILVSTIGNHIKIIDFGYSETGAEYLTRRLGGTAEFSAPEVLEGNTDIPSTASSDIFSLGGIIEALLPGKYRHVIRKCHETDPDRRYHDIDSLRRAIKRSDRWRAGMISLLVALSSIPGLIFAINALYSSVEQKYEEKTMVLQERIDSLMQTKTENENQMAVLEEKVRRFTKDSLEIVELIKDFERLVYTPVADSLSDPSRTPYLELSYRYQSRYVEKTNEFKRNHCPKKYHYDCDTIYARYLGKIYKIVDALPKVDDHLKQGLISPDEARYYRDLHMKPFVPYPGKKKD